MRAALGFLLGLAVAGCAAEPPPPRHDLVLVTIDTLRRDHLGLYGYDRPVSPAIDALAAEALVFDNAVAPCPATAPSVASILTGLHRASHGVGRNASSLPETVVTLAERLRQAGYRTGGFVANPMVDEPLGFAQGFDEFEMPEGLQRKGPAAFRGAPLVERAERFLDGAGEEPVFLWVHFMDPHGPYFPPKPARQRFAAESYPSEETWPPLSERNHGLGIVPRYQRVRGQEIGERLDPAALRARYDAEIRHVDGLVGRLVEALRERRRWNDAVFVLTADHGESLGENDYYFQHGWFLYQNALAVPLLLRGPGVEAGRFAGVVSTVDVAPTVLELLGLQLLGLELLGLEPAEEIEGRSLWPLPADEKPVFAQSYYGNRLSMARQGSLKYILTPPPPPAGRDDRPKDGWIDHWPEERREELYDLATDPDETRNLLATAEGERLAVPLRRTLGRWLKEQRERKAALLEALRSEEGTDRARRRVRREIPLEEQLRALGYL